MTQTSNNLRIFHRRNQRWRRSVPILRRGNQRRRPAEAAMKLINLLEGTRSKHACSRGSAKRLFDSTGCTSLAVSGERLITFSCSMLGILYAKCLELVVLSFPHTKVRWLFYHLLIPSNIYLIIWLAVSYCKLLINLQQEPDVDYICLYLGAHSVLHGFCVYHKDFAYARSKPNFVFDRFCKYVLARVCELVWIPMYAFACTPMWGCMYAYVRLHVRLCAFACACVRMCACMCAAWCSISAKCAGDVCDASTITADKW